MRQVPAHHHSHFRPQSGRSGGIQHTGSSAGMVHHHDYLRPSGPCTPIFLLFAVQGKGGDGPEGVCGRQGKRPVDGVRTQQAPPRACLLLRHGFRYDERGQRGRFLLHELQRRCHSAAYHALHVAGHHPCVHLYAAGACHQAQDRQEGHVLPLPRHSNPGYGAHVHLRVHPRPQGQLRAPVHRPVHQVYRHHRGNRLHVGPRAGGHSLR